METWRVFFHSPQDAFTNMAIDELLLRQGTPTLRFYQWSPSAVSIGYFQGIHDEVNIESCREKHIDVVRRLTGGGAVYHDEMGDITYSIITPDSRVPPDIQESYAYLCAGLVKGFHILGLQARFSPINDILVNNKKISGSAQTRRFSHVLQHGTILCSLDPHLMFSLLRVSQEKIRDKDIQNVTDRVTSIDQILGPLDKNTILAAMVTGFMETLNVVFQQGELTQDDQELISKIRRKYAQKKWNFKR